MKGSYKDTITYIIYNEDNNNEQECESGVK